MDFVVSRKASPKAPASRRSKKGLVSRLSWLRVLGRRPARTVLGAAFSAVLVGIAINALFFQTARHPAPLMNTGEIKKPAPATVAAVPVPAPRPVETVQQAAPAAPQNILPAAARSAPAVDANDSKQVRDPIAALLRSGSPAAASNDGEKAKIQSAQRALIKLGFAVKADGAIGATTRQAIETFERDRNLPITGALGAKTVRELSAQSRIAIP